GLIYSGGYLVIPGNPRRGLMLPGANDTPVPILDGVVSITSFSNSNACLISISDQWFRRSPKTKVSRKNYKKISHNHVFRPNHWSLMGQSDLSYDLPFDHYQARNFILSKKNLWNFKHSR
ncbi:hypothetical protein J6590_093231, partial [Homalodisca vitripennis]